MVSARCGAFPNPSFFFAGTSVSGTWKLKEGTLQFESVSDNADADADDDEDADECILCNASACSLVAHLCTVCSPQAAADDERLPRSHRSHQRS
jgi:hypothetical protein